MKKSVNIGVAELNIGGGKGARAPLKVYKSTGVQCKLQDLDTTITIDKK